MSDKLVCVDCMIVIANNDTSGVADDHYQAVIDGVAALGGSAYVSGDAGFMSFSCDCCGDTDAGERFEVNLMEV